MSTYQRELFDGTGSMAVAIADFCEWVSVGSGSARFFRRPIRDPAFAMRLFTVVGPVERDRRGRAVRRSDSLKYARINVFSRATKKPDRYFWMTPWPLAGKDHVFGPRKVTRRITWKPKDASRGLEVPAWSRHGVAVFAEDPFSHMLLNPHELHTVDWMSNLQDLVAMKEFLKTQSMDDEDTHVQIMNADLDEFDADPDADIEAIEVNVYFPAPFRHWTFMSPKEYRAIQQTMDVPKPNFRSRNGQMIGWEMGLEDFEKAPAEL